MIIEYHMTHPLAGFGRTSVFNFEAAYVEQSLDEDYYTDRGLFISFLYLAIYLDATMEFKRARNRYVRQDHAFFCYSSTFI